MTAQTSTTEKRYLKASEVARIFQVNHSTVFLWVKKGKLRPKRSFGGQFRFSRRDIEKLLKTTDMREHAEQRKEERYQLDFIVVLKTILAERPHFNTATVTDISRHGIGLSLDDDRGLLKELDKGVEPEVTIMNYANPLFKSKTIGNIRHYRAQGDGKAAIGVALN